MSQLRRGWDESPSLRALRAATEAASRVRPAVARRAGLSQSELVALEHLTRAPMGPGQLARLLGVTTAASTGVVDRLVSRGHATRDPRPDDRRRTDVSLTASGRQEVWVRLMPMFNALQALDDTFDDAEKAVVARYLEGAAEAFETVAGPAAGSQAEVEA